MNEQTNTSRATSRAPAIAGFLFAGAVILSLGFLGGRDGGTTDVPVLRVLEPATGDTVAGAIPLRFATPAPLRLEGAQGWVAGELHLHAMVDGVEIMPAAADIQTDGDAFVWTLPPLSDGTHRIHLTWAGRHHGNLPGVTDTLTVHVMAGANAPSSDAAPADTATADPHAGH